jgi:hypothetical protein
VISYLNGFLVGRLAHMSVDHGTGHEVFRPGRHVRIRVERIATYLSAEPGTVEVTLDVPIASDEYEEALFGIELMGSIEEVDDALKRHVMLNQH